MTDEEKYRDLQDQNKLLAAEIARLREAQALWESWFTGLKAFIAARWPPDESRHGTR